MSDTTSVSSTTSTSSTSSTTSSSSSSSYTDFDIDSLVEAKLESRLERIDSLETEVSDNETKISAYEEMQSDLQDLEDTLVALRSYPGVSNEDDDVFKEREAYLTSSDSSVTASDCLSATVDPGTDMGTHTIVVSQIATTNIICGTTMSSSSDDLGWSGTITLGTEDGDSADITITTSMSLADIVDAINADTTTSGVKASVMKVADGEYELVLTSSSTGETITASGDLLGSSYLGVLDDNGDIPDDNVLQAAQDAELTVDGVSITRSTNDIDDILDGVTLHLYAATQGATLTLDIDYNLSDIASAVAEFVDAYNTFRDFVVTNQTTDTDGTADDGATLYGDSILRITSQQLQSILTSTIDETSLAAIGITFDSDNTLVLDTTTLENALLDDIDAVQTLFAYQATTSSDDLQLVSHDDGPQSANFTVSVGYDSDGNLTLESVTDSDGNDITSDFSISGSVISGVDDTDYEGLSFVYTGSTAKSITVSISQGIADQLYYAVDAVANDTDGTLTDAITALEDTDTDINSRISSLEDSLSTYSDYLYTLYAKYAAKISEAQTTIALLKALLSSDSSS